MPNATKNSPVKNILFISDLHLCASRPQITKAFLQFLNTAAAESDALYILGDLFEYWAGDDDIDDPFNQQIIHGFKTLAETGVTIYLMHGNRDFLIGDAFCKAAKVHLLPDPSTIIVNEKKILLSHGDDLCTDDTAYQQFRLQVRDQQWRQAFLNQPLALRKQQIEAIRARSEQEKSHKSMEIMDVNRDAVAQLLSQHQPDIFIHGHTHRPKQHFVEIAGKVIARWVLGDWYEQGSYLLLDADGCHSVQL